MKRPGTGFIRLTHALVDGEAFMLASNGARCLLILIWRRFNGRNNGQIPLSVREAADWLHCGKTATARYFAELQQLGLIEAVTKGQFAIKSGTGKNAATTWRLTFLQNERADDDKAA